MTELVQIMEALKYSLDMPSVALDLAILRNLLYQRHNSHRKFKFFRIFKQIQSLMKKFARLKLRKTLLMELK